MRATALLATISVMSIATVLGLASCEGFKSKTPTASSANPPSTTSPSTTDASVTASSSGSTTTAVGAIPPASDGSTPSRPEHLVIRVAYVVDAGQSESSMMELEREGTYKLERRGGDLAGADPKDVGSMCSGTLSADVGGALWKAVDAAAFVPSESGFSKPIQAPRQQQTVTQQGRYSVTRMLADLSMVPADEAGARALVQPIRTAISTAEKQSASSGTCTKLPRR